MLLLIRRSLVEYAPYIKCAKLNHLLFHSLSFSGNPDDLSWYSQAITNIRLDVHAVDGDGNLYNIEKQKDDRGAERKRARY